MSRLEEQGIMRDGESNPEYVNAGVLGAAYVFGMGGALYIGANIHFIAFCIALNLCLGLATVFVWRSGVVPPFFFGRGWRAVRYSEDAELYWLNLGALIFGFAASMVFTVLVIAETVYGAA